jgi:hypothetical protein
LRTVDRFITPQTFILEMTRNFRNYANQLRPHHHQIIISVVTQ